MAVCRDDGEPAVRHDRQDRDALVALAKGMASRNGYRAMQASDLYVASGTTADYLYGKYRIFAFTIELSSVDYPRDTVIASETGRNRDAVLWLAERAWCPLSVLGATVREARCGALDDDLEVYRGWKTDPDGTDTAPASARWTRGNPAGTTISGVTGQPTTTPSGRSALVSGLPAGSRSYSYDLDGRTTVRSPSITLPGGAGQRLTFRWLLAHGANASTRTTCGRSSRPPTARRPSSGSSAARRRSSRGSGARHRWRWTPGRARPSGSGSRPPMRAAPRPSRSASTTCGSRAQPGDALGRVTCPAGRRDRPGTRPGDAGP